MFILRFASMISFLCLAGCLVNHTRVDVSSQICVFGIELYSGVDYREINGVRSVEEPCLKGYERSFDQLEITIGYGFDRKIRKITTRNPATSMFGISPGIQADEAVRLARQSGFSEISAYRFKGQNNNLTLLVDKGKVFGITMERLD
jgi:hypothetical protein